MCEKKFTNKETTESLNFEIGGYGKIIKEFREKEDKRKVDFNLIQTNVENVGNIENFQQNFSKSPDKQPAIASAIQAFDNDFNKLLNELEKRNKISSSGKSYNIKNLVGKIICRDYTQNGNFYEDSISAPGGIFEDGAEPIYTIIAPEEREINYSNKIYDDKKLNIVSSILGGIKGSAEKKRLIEVSIKDDVFCDIDINKISKVKFNNLKQQLSQTQLSESYIIERVIVCTFEHRIYTETKVSADATTVYISVGGTAYSSNDTYNCRKEVHISIKKLDKIFFTN